MGTATFVGHDKFPAIQGNKRVRSGLLTLSNSYAANGDSIDFAAVSGIKRVDSVIINPSIGGFGLSPNVALTKVLAFETGSGSKRITNFFDSEEIQQVHFVAGNTVADEILSWIPQFDGEITAFDLEYGSLGDGRTIVDLEIDGTTALDDELESCPAVIVTETITYANSPETATRAAGSYIDDGLAVGDVVVLTGSANNDGTYTIITLTATVMTVTEAFPTAEADTQDGTFTPNTITALVRTGAIASGAKQFTNGQQITIDVDSIAANTAATDLSIVITVKRYVAVKTSIVEFTAPVTGTISAVTLEVGVGGSGGGGTTIDVNINDVSCMSVEPVVAHDAADGSQDTGTINTAADDVTIGDTISIDIDAVPTNKDCEQISVQIEFTPTIDAMGEVVAGSDLSGETAIIHIYGK